MSTGTVTYKQYIGDGVYADYDGYMICLTTEDGVDIKNKIYLEPVVMKALIDYATKIGVLRNGAGEVY